MTRAVEVGMESGYFDRADLERMRPPAGPVILKSGGLVMSLDCTEGDQGVCSWADGVGVVHRRMLPLACLYMCVAVPE